jgi:hypothetical protein
MKALPEPHLLKVAQSGMSKDALTLLELDCVKQWQEGMPRKLRTKMNYLYRLHQFTKEYGRTPQQFLEDYAVDPKKTKIAAKTILASFVDTPSEANVMMDALESFAV